MCVKVGAALWMVLGTGMTRVGSVMELVVCSSRCAKCDEVGFRLYLGCSGEFDFDRQRDGGGVDEFEDEVMALRCPESWIRRCGDW